MRTPLTASGCLGLCLLLAMPAGASTYKALCGNDPCTIHLDANGIRGPGLKLPTERIARWFSGGEVSYDATSGTAGALGGGTAGAMAGGLLLGPVGLVGGMVGGALAGSRTGQRADLYFNVIGYDREGQRRSLSFRFINPRPAAQLRQELPMFTGLAMGQTRDLASLQRGSVEAGELLPEQLPERLPDRLPERLPDRLPPPPPAP